MRTQRSSLAALGPTSGPPAAETAAEVGGATDHAILLKQSERGWLWQVIDTNGVSVAQGFSTDQGEAMSSAHRAISLYP